MHRSPDTYMADLHQRSNTYNKAPREESERKSNTRRQILDISSDSEIEDDP